MGVTKKTRSRDTAKVAPVKPTMSAEARAKLAEKARRQWADPNSKIRAGNKARQQWADPEGKLRERQKEGAAVMRIKPPKDAAEIIEHCVAEYGSTKEMLSEHFGISIFTFDRWLRDHSDIREAFERSKGIEHSKLIGVLYGQALKGNTTAAIVLLKFRHNYRDSGPLPGEANDPTIQALRIKAALKAITAADALDK